MKKLKIIENETAFKMQTSINIDGQSPKGDNMIYPHISEVCLKNQEN
jgi:hypothetical protein